LPRPPQTDLKLWYNEPAKTWTEALPVGNGRLGAMVFGRVQEELIQLNEATLWSGGPADLNPNPEAPNYLPQVREALFKGNYKTAQEICRKLQGRYTESYLPLGDLVVRHRFTGQPTGYSRELDLVNATATTRFTLGGTRYTREVLASAPDQVIVIRLRAEGKEKLNFDVVASSPLRFTADGGRRSRNGHERQGARPTPTPTT
jgi:alpha-L-fucosidase 2